MASGDLTGKRLATRRKGLPRACTAEGPIAADTPHILGRFSPNQKGDIRLEAVLPYDPIERFNNTLRQWVSRLVRERLSFSKKLANHSRAITYCICHDNLTRAGAWHGAHSRAGPRCLVQAREHDDRYLPRGLVLILDKNR